MVYPRSPILEPSADDTGDPGAASTGLEAVPISPVRYDPSRHGSAARFALGPDFARFGDGVTALIDRLKRAIPDDARALAAFDTLRGHLLDVDGQGLNLYYGKFAADVYGRSVELLERMAQLIADPRTPPADVRVELADAAWHVGKCPVAVFESLETSVKRLTPPRDLAGRWQATRTQIVQQVAHAAVSTHFAEELKHAPGSHVHLVHPLLEQLQQRLGIPCALQPDPLAAPSTPPELANRCIARLTVELDPTSVAEWISGDYLGLLSQRLARLTSHRTAQGAEGRGLRATAGDDAASGPVPTMEEIDIALGEVAAEFGVTAPPDAVLRSDLGSCMPSSDPTVLALHIADLAHAEDLSAGVEAQPLSPSDGSRPQTLFFRRERLAWAVEDGRRRPLDAEDLARLRVEELPSHALMHAVHNSSPDQLIACAQPAWIVDGNVAAALCARLDDPALQRWLDRHPEAWHTQRLPLIRLQNALMEGSRFGPLWSPMSARWCRLALPGYRSAEELFELSTSPGHEQQELSDTLGRALDAALAPLTSEALRLYGPSPARGEPDVRRFIRLLEWFDGVARARHVTPSRLDDKTLGAALGIPSHDFHAVLDIQHVERLTRLLALLNEIPSGSTLDRVISERLWWALVKNDGSRQPALQSVWAHGDQASFSSVLSLCLRALSRLANDPDQMTAGLTLDGPPRDERSREYIDGALTAINEIRKVGASPASMVVRLDFSFDPPIDTGSGKPEWRKMVSGFRITFPGAPASLP